MHLTSVLCSVLASTCHLFLQCELLQDCRGCVTGPARCQETCDLPPARGGRWYCESNMRVTPARAKSLGGTLDDSNCLHLTEVIFREMLFSLRGEEPAGGDVSLRQVEPGHGPHRWQAGLQNEVGHELNGEYSAYFLYSCQELKKAVNWTIKV